MTIVAVDDWMTAVISIPVRNATQGLFVTFSIAAFRAPEEFSFRESPISLIPYRNMARPPNRERTLNMLIYLSSVIEIIYI